MKTSKDYLADIEKLRRQHTANFRRGNFATNASIQRKIIRTWDAYHRAMEAETKIVKDEFNFFIVNKETNHWSRRSRTMRGAIAGLRSLKHLNCFVILPIPAGHPARLTKGAI